MKITENSPTVDIIEDTFAYNYINITQLFKFKSQNKTLTEEAIIRENFSENSALKQDKILSAH